MSDDTVAHTVAIVTAVLANPNSPLTSEWSVPELIEGVYNALHKIEMSATAASSLPPLPILQPAVNPKKSIHDDYLVCLEDGQKFKSIKRHLHKAHGMSPEQYRAKWSLAGDYPMIAPNYAAVRSTLAKQTGLGRGRKVRPQ